VWILKGRPAPENIYLIKILINYGIINRRARVPQEPMRLVYN
jgi:hypothetical protein